MRTRALTVAVWVVATTLAGIAGAEDPSADAAPAAQRPGPPAPPPPGPTAGTQVGGGWMPGMQMGTGSAQAPGTAGATGALPQAGFAQMQPGMGGMGCMGGMGGMGGMGRMGMGGMNMGGMNMGPVPMAMGGGMTLQSMVQLVTIQDILQSLLDLSEAQEAAINSRSAPDRDKTLKILAEVREKVRELQRETRAQITGAGRTE